MGPSSVSDLTRTAHAFTYARPSSLTASGAGQALDLETAGGLTPAGADAHPQFFTGFLSAPQAPARALLAVADVASARYQEPAQRRALLAGLKGLRGELRSSRWERWGARPPTAALLDVLSGHLRRNEEVPAAGN
ncbi:hypothetical protein [Streptomyces sp. NPDC001502]|uniref:hypothetical protein n=1 Tax=Streptomyces sp. NPDC001502 TaxID=3364578 RepID=UPI0036BF1562